MRNQTTLSHDHFETVEDRYLSHLYAALRYALKVKNEINANLYAVAIVRAWTGKDVNPRFITK